MKLDYLKNNHSQNNKNIVSVGLLGISGFMVVLILIKVTAFYAAPARAEDSVKRAVELTKPDPNDTEKVFAKSRAIANQLKKNNLFAPPIPKRHPVNKDQVLGILGDEVFINNKWYKAGDNVGDAKIVAITPIDVTIEWDGSEQVFVPMDAKVAAASGPRRPGGPGPGGPQAAKEGQQGGPETVQVQLEVRGGEGMGRFGGGDMMARMREMRERWESMSPEEREQARAEMRDRFGGRGGPGGGRGPRGEGGFGGRRGGRGR